LPGTLQPHITHKLNRGNTGQTFKLFVKRSTAHVHAFGHSLDIKTGIGHFFFHHLYHFLQEGLIFRGHYHGGRSQLNRRLLFYQRVKQFFPLPQQVPDRSHQKIVVERLGNIIVGAILQPLDLAFYGIPGREQNHRNMAGIDIGFDLT
jgi:hypothetical protein